MHNITLKNVHQYGTLLPPGIIRCNSTNPCTGFVFDNVKAHGWWRIFGLNYIVENVEGVVTDSKPDPGFKNILDADSQADDDQFDFKSFMDDNVYPAIASMLDNSYQAAISKKYLLARQGYADVFRKFTQ